jgi:hypothetical protein
MPRQSFTSQGTNLNSATDFDFDPRKLLRRRSSLVVADLPVREHAHNDLAESKGTLEESRESEEEGNEEDEEENKIEERKKKKSGKAFLQVPIILVQYSRTGLQTANDFGGEESACGWIRYYVPTS